MLIKHSVFFDYSSDILFLFYFISMHAIVCEHSPKNEALLSLFMGIEVTLQLGSD